MGGGARQDPSPPLPPPPPRGPAQAEAAWPQADLRQTPHSRCLPALHLPLHTRPLTLRCAGLSLPPWNPGRASVTRPLAPAPPGLRCPAPPSAARTSGPPLLLFSRTGLCPLVFAGLTPSCLGRLWSNASSPEEPSQTSLYKKRPWHSFSSQGFSCPLRKLRPTPATSGRASPPSSQSECELHAGGRWVLSERSVNCC